MKALTFETGETVTLLYQLREDGAAKDITGMGFIFAAKERHTDAAYMVAPVAGAIDDAASGRFSFEVTMPSSPFAGVYGVVMEAGGKRTVLTSPGGDGIRVLESLVD